MDYELDNKPVIEEGPLRRRLARDQVCDLGWRVGYSMETVDHSRSGLRASARLKLRRDFLSLFLLPEQHLTFICFCS